MADKGVQKVLRDLELESAIPVFERKYFDNFLFYITF